MDKSREPVGRWLGSAAGKLLGAALIGATILLIGLSFRFGIDRGHDTSITLKGHGHFWNAVCAILSRQQYGTGRYVCAQAVELRLQKVGLHYADATLRRVGKTLPELLRDGTFLNEALRTMFSSSPGRDPGVLLPIGWGMDAGYSDFVEFAFLVFGHRVESLYSAFFLLLAVSTGLICLQFFDKPFVLFSVLAFHYGFWFSLELLGGLDLQAVNNPRLLSILAVVPFVHALFLMAYRIQPSSSTILLFGPQAILLAAAGDFRTTAFWTVIALGLFWASFAATARWRHERLPTVLLQGWPAGLTLACVGCAILLGTVTTDHRLTAIGGMRRHAFWQPLYYNLQLHSGWNAKYSERHLGATGDDTAVVAVATYRRRHPELESRGDYVMGDKAGGLSQVAYEKYVRAAYLEFLRNDPRYVLELKYENAATILHAVRVTVARAWESLTWKPLVLIAGVALALGAGIWRGAERFAVLTWGTALVIASAALVAGSLWATVVVIDAMYDTLIMAMFATAVTALWMTVGLGVLVGKAGAALARRRL